MNLLGTHRAFRPALARWSKRLGGGPRTADQGVVEVTRRFAGRRLHLHVRNNTLDLDLLDLILCDQGTYALPNRVRPRIIFDIGANIGIAAASFATLYPEADIYCFEPLPANLELLRENAAQTSDRIRILPFGLSDRRGRFEYCMSDNPRSFGGGTFCRIGHDPSRTLDLPVETVAHVLEEAGLDHVDVFKIDTEGSEMAILRGIPETVLRRTQAIVGELHGVQDWQVCQMLSDSHTMGIAKPLDRACFPFIAVRRDLVAGKEAAKAA